MSLAAVAELLRSRVGIDPPSLGANHLRNVVAERMRVLGLTDPGRYAARLADSAEEFGALADDVLVPETWFFRGGAVFTFLADHVRTTTASRPSGPPQRALSAPCSSGEEPYSLAIALAEVGVPRERWSIDAIDLGSRNLRRARQARYGESAFRETPPELRRRYFQRGQDGWELDPALRGAVRFRQGNLVDPQLLAGEGPFDLVFCRNVLIYLHAAAREVVLANLDRLLAVDGLLCMGHAEPLSLIDRRFQPTGPSNYFLFRRRAALPSAPREAPRAKPRPQPAAVAPRGAGRPRPPAAVAAPAMSEELIARARAQADAGALREAFASCQAHLAVAGPSADAYSLLGVIHQARKEPAEAAAAFRKALYLEPGHADALLHLMLLSSEIGDHDGASRLRQRLARTTPRGDG
jgi:chemotaxis protein methyltransferase WspC